MSIDLEILGAPELQRAFNRIVDKTQKSIVRSALRKEAKRAKQRVVDNIRRFDLIDTGIMVAAFEGVKIKSAGNRRLIRIGPETPTRAALQIAPDDKHYYPYALEYGGYSFIRPAVDEHKRESYRILAIDIGTGIERAAKR